MAFQHINNFKTVTTASLASGVTTVSVPPADAAVLEAKSPTSSDPVQLTLFDGTNLEIIQCTAANGTTGDVTVVRQQEGTTSPSSFAAGTKVTARITAAMLDSYTGGGGGGGPNVTNHGTLTGNTTIVPVHGDLHVYTVSNDATVAIYLNPAASQGIIVVEVAVICTTFGVLGCDITCTTSGTAYSENMQKELEGFSSFTEGGLTTHDAGTSGNLFLSSDNSGVWYKYFIDTDNFRAMYTMDFTPWNGA